MRYVEDNRRQTTEIEVRVSECTDVAYCLLDSLSTRGVGSNEVRIPPRGADLKVIHRGTVYGRHELLKPQLKCCDTTIDYRKLISDSIYCITLRSLLIIYKVSISISIIVHVHDYEHSTTKQRKNPLQDSHTITKVQKVQST
jgi:hypothetical protein